MIVIFDLDDTLYNERTYVESGLKAVAEYMQSEWNIPARKAYTRMVKLLDTDGRGALFDRVLEEYGFATRSRVQKCIQVYRSHTPHISLYSDAKRALKRLSKNHELYIVTDGNSRVQRRKAHALGLPSLVKKVVPTGHYGHEAGKPSTFCFERIINQEGVLNSEAVYIGDDPHKDFVGIKKIGLHTVRVQRGRFAQVKLSEEYEAQYGIETLDEITDEFLAGL